MRQYKIKWIVTLSINLFVVFKVSSNFTDEEGEFVFGPLCPDRHYAIQIWANATKKIKICAKCHHEGKCLKGEKHEKCDCFIDDKKPWHRNESVEESKDDCCEE